jgi:hypothetical protein
MTHEVDRELGLHHLRTSLELRERWGDSRWIPSGTLVVGIAELAAGRREEALDHFRAAVRLAREARLSERRVRDAEEWLRRAESGEPLDLR